MTINDLKEISLNGFIKDGEGATSVLYISESDQTKAIKVFKETVPFEGSMDEYLRSANVAKLGLSTPRIFEVGKVGKCVAVVFERIVGKKSFSRAIADNPEKLEELMTVFAEECLKLHNTECDTSFFPSINETYKSIISHANFLDEKEKANALKMIENLDDKTTCLHGDMHPGNIILDKEMKPYWIDLGGFSYGNPVFDLSSLYFLFNVVCSKPFAQQNFHMTEEQMRRAWKAFEIAYFGTTNEKKLKEIDELMFKYSVFFNIYAKVVLGINPEKNTEFIKLMLNQAL